MSDEEIVKAALRRGAMDMVAGFVDGRKAAESVLLAAIRLAREDERALCCRLVCPGCEYEGEPKRDHDGHLYHETMLGNSQRCRAERIREQP